MAKVEPKGEQINYKNQQFSLLCIIGRFTGGKRQFLTLKMFQNLVSFTENISVLVFSVGSSVAPAGAWQLAGSSG